MLKLLVHGCCLFNTYAGMPAGLLLYGWSAQFHAHIVLVSRHPAVYMPGDIPQPAAAAYSHVLCLSCYLLHAYLHSHLAEAFDCPCSAATSLGHVGCLNRECAPEHAEA